ncbi:MAG TPA: sulfite exporter TauE/SafE family protein [Aquabacterium sp.]|uniref:sulfite exporter TauE/SafE family protein n=1 Tax=Aquabacterium sp. TaxID=1872578 RepID=UPI002E364737|nr:sulfite exporter TauE/SafE family protein [Aquabacterium sp.]HEX5355156.1 sulfite exporter TauE/SafE family protein [Aquabacterium sp.]
MLSSLMLTAFLMGLGGIPHCAAMCGAACAAFLPRGVPLTSLVGRCLGYAVLGAVAAASFGAAAQWGRQFSFLQPLWMLAQALVLVLGILLLVSGGMPRQFDSLGQQVYRDVRARLNASEVFREGGKLRAIWPLVAGMAWALLPCGLLYAAVMVAALAPDPMGGAMVMLAFALPGALGVWGAPAVLRWLSAWRSPAAVAAGAAAPVATSQSELAPVLWLKSERASDDAAVCAGGSGQSQWAASSGLVDPRWAVRLSGLMLVGMSAWALYHQVMDQWKAWCA